MITTMLAAGGKRARAAAGAAAAALAMAAVLGPVPAAAHTAPGVHAAPAAQAAPAAAATAPPGREWAAFAYYPPQHQLVLFAGSERALQVFPSTIWSWNGSTWSRGT